MPQLRGWQVLLYTDNQAARTQVHTDSRTGISDLAGMYLRVSLQQQVLDIHCCIRCLAMTDDKPVELVLLHTAHDQPGEFQMLIPPAKYHTTNGQLTTVSGGQHRVQE